MGKLKKTPVPTKKGRRQPVDDDQAPVAEWTRSRSGVPREDCTVRANTTSPTTRKQKAIDEEEEIIEIPPEVKDQPRHEAINTGPKTPFVEEIKALPSDDKEKNFKGILRKGKPGSGRRVAFAVDVKGGEGASGEDEKEEPEVNELDSDGEEVYRSRTPSDPPKENPLVTLWEYKCGGFEQLVEGIFGMNDKGEPVYTTHKAHKNCNYYKGENEPHDCGIFEMGLIWCDCTLSSYEPVLCLPFYRESAPVYS